MAKKRALVFTTIQGHKSISDTLTSILETHAWEVHTAMYVDPALTLYRWLYRYAPALCKIYYLMLFFPGVERLVHLYTSRTHSQVFHDALRQFPDSDLMISTSYGFDALISQWKLRQHKNGRKVPQYINAVVDPRTFFPVDLSAGADQNLVFDDVTAASCQQLKPRANIAVTGWFTRPQFRSTVTKRAARADLGLAPDQLTLLFVAGSEGETKSAKLIPSLLHQTTPTQIILACGSNAQLKAKFDAIAVKIPKDSSITLRTLPFTKEIHRYMHAANLIIGKAGPNMIFEAVAAETPFFATTHISGQEDGNLTLIREYQIGYVEEKLQHAVQLLKDIIDDPTQLEKFSTHLQTLAQFNDQSADKFMEVVAKLRDLD